MGIYFFHIAAGVVAGLLFTMLFINVNGIWKKAISSIGTMLLTEGGTYLIYRQLWEADHESLLIALGWFMVFFLVAYIAFMFILSFLIRDNSKNDALRLRDILLGQQSYIDYYYKQRKKEISEKLLPEIERRERAIKKDEKYIEDEKNKLNAAGTKKLKIIVPENKSVILSKEYIDLIPSYVLDVANCIHDINDLTAHFIERARVAGGISYSDFKTYLLGISIFISKDIFGSRENDVRVHFRQYDESENGYKKMIAVVGCNKVDRNMTFIPYDDANMIKKSFECKKALIKNMNAQYDYQSDNHTVWENYMTYAFYNFKRKNKAILSIGISVKNDTRFKNIFLFLNHVKFEDYLSEVLGRINDEYSIENILYSE